MSRIRSNFQTGTLDLGGLTTGGTTASSSAFASLPVVTNPDVLAISLEPDTVNQEIVWVTAHSSGATSCTISRGQESTTAIAHAIDAVWVHGPTVADFVSGVTSVASTSSGLVVTNGSGPAVSLAIATPTMTTVGSGGGAPAYQNGWISETAAGGTGIMNLCYWKDSDGAINLQGACNGSSKTGNTIFTLPVGFRPDKKFITGANDGGSGFQRIDIDIDGTVTDQTGFAGGLFFATRFYPTSGQ